MNWRLVSGGRLARWAFLAFAASLLAPVAGAAATVGAGYDHSLAVKEDGTVWAWGNNAYGQLGNGGTTGSTTPAQVSGLSNFVAVAAGKSFSLALKEDGTVWAWGLNTNGQVGIGSLISPQLSPVQVTGLTGVIAIAAGDLHALALKGDGSVWAWGSNGNGRLGDGTTTQRTSPVRVVGQGGSGFLTDVVDIAAGGSHSLAAKSDATAWAWGKNANGQIGNSKTSTGVLTPVQVVRLLYTNDVTLTGVKSVAAGGSHSLAARSDGTVWAWGANASGQLGNGDTTDQNKAVQSAAGTDIVAISAGAAHSMAIRDDGTAWAWGANGGRLGDGTTLKKIWPVQVAGLSGAIQLAAGVGHSLGLTSGGTLWAWGSNTYGQLGDGTTTQQLTPVQVNGSGYMWKAATPTFDPAPGTYGATGEIAITSATPRATIRYTTSGVDPTKSDPVLPAGSTVPLTENLTLKAKAWARDLAPSDVATGDYVLKVAAPVFNPPPGTYPGLVDVTISTTTSGATVHYTTDGTVPNETAPTYAAPVPIGNTTNLNAAAYKPNWGASDVTGGQYQMNFGTLAAPTATPAPGTFIGSVDVTLTAQAGTTLYYTTDGTPPTTSSAIYTNPIHFEATATIQAFAYHVDWTPSTILEAPYTIKVATPTLSPASGTYPVGTGIAVAVATPGATIHYTTNGADPSESDPVVASGGRVYPGADATLKVAAWKPGLAASDVASGTYDMRTESVAAGSAHSFALTSAGNGWTWGANDSGQIGDGTTTLRPLPVMPPALAGLSVIAAGSAHGVGLKPDGTIVAWGLNANGQVGNNSTSPQYSPVAVSGISSVAAVSAGEAHSIALLSDGTVKAWGSNGNGRLGDGTTTQRLTPASVSNLTDAVAVAAGGAHTLALRSDGTVWAWGANDWGQLGASGGDAWTPTQVAGLTSVVAIAAGSSHSLALEADGTVWAWGYNGSGQLGDGSESESSSTPVQVLGLTGVRSIAAGASHSLAVLSDGTVQAWGLNADGQLGDGTTDTIDVPVPVTGLTGVARVAGGDSHSLAVTDDGSLWAWGANASSQLGDGTTNPSLVPVRVSDPGFGAKAGTPTFSPAPGEVTTAPSVTMASATSGATIRYTTDGSEPTAGSTEYTAPVALSGSATVKAKAFLAGLGDSNVAAGAYTLRVPTPTVSPASGNYTQSFNATITCTNCGGTIRYTTDGSEPTESSPSGSPVPVSTSLTLKAKVFRAGWTPSDTVLRAYSFPVAAPTFSPAGGTYTSAQTVTVSTPTPGATIHYTTDGLAPTELDPVIASGGSVPVDRSMTLRAKAWLSGWTPSATTVANYALSYGTAAAPTMTPPPGSYTAAQNVVLDSATPGATIRYTLDGSDPTWASAPYVKPILVDGTITVKAMAFRADMAPSAIATGAYTVAGTGVATPRFGAAAGVYRTAVSVTVTCDTTGATIHYTTNGADPTEADPTIVSGAALSVDRALILKAKAWVGAPASGVRRADYVVTGALAAGSSPTAGLTLALKADGTVWAYGSNGQGQIGLGTVGGQQRVPVQVPGLEGVVSVAAGLEHALAVKSDGTLWAWGDNLKGQLGLGDTTDRSSPTQVPTLIGVVAVAAGQQHSLALKSDGTVWAWGLNTVGEVGNGTTSSYVTQPVRSGTLTDVVAIAAGRVHSLALKSDGTMWAWGGNINGQLGDGTTQIKTSPVPVVGIAGVTSIGAGGLSSYALKSDGALWGSLWAWGENSSGQLADGATADHKTPTRVLDGVSAVAAGDLHVLAMTRDGALWAAGDNAYAQYGDGSQAPSRLPVPGARIGDAVLLTAGAGDTLAVVADGGVWGWGSNYSGQLGDGSFTNPQPLPVSASLLSLVPNAWLTEDTDSDGLTNAAEYRVGTDPLAADTNGDGVLDGVELGMGGNPGSLDSDADGLTVAEELAQGTNPWNADSDGDGTLDGADCQPLDPTQAVCVPNPSDQTPPTITLTEPASAVVLP